MPFTEQEDDLIVDGVREEQEAELYELQPIYPGASIFTAVVIGLRVEEEKRNARSETK